MPETSAKPTSDQVAGFDELDRVRLRHAILVEGRALDPGLVGTIVLCHGNRAFEVEFDGINDVFAIPAEYLDRS